jgi:hypothetical protein
LRIRYGGACMAKQRHNHRRGVFISYSHLDRPWLSRVQTILAPVVRSEKIELWDDTKIQGGTDWALEIQSAIERARVAILLVSANFLASKFIADVELPRLLDQRKEGLTVLWLPISSALYQATRLKEIQAASDPRRPLDTLSRPHQQRVLVDLASRVSDAMDLNSLAGVLRIADQFTAQQDAFLEGQPAPATDVRFGITAHQVDDQIRFADKAGGTVTVIERAHLQSLDPRSQQLIRAYEQAMEDLFDRWTELEPKCYARDTVVRQRARDESNEIRKDMCGQLTKILNFIEKVHGYLADHYQHVRTVCGQSTP